MSETDKVSEDKIYEFVTSQIQFREQGAINAFKLFLQVFSAIVGGSIWLSIQSSTSQASRPGFAAISDALVGLVFAVTAIMVAENFRGWLGYRKAQSKMAGEYPDGRLRVPRPKIFPPVIAEAALVLCMAIASGLFVWFNPFLLKAN